MAQPEVKPNCSKLATACFIGLAVALLYAVVRILGGRIARDLNRVEPTPATSIAAPMPDAEPTPEGSEVFHAIVSPGIPTATPAATPRQPSLVPSAAPTASPAPTAEESAARHTLSFTRERMELAFIGLDGNGRPDCIVLAVSKGARCELLFLPKNTLDRASRPLSAAKGAEACILALETLLPLEIDRYLAADLTRIGACVDALGGIERSGERLDGKTVQAELLDPRSDELIRISRQQSLLHAFIAELRTAGLLRLAGTKAALQRCIGGNLTPAQYLTLYQAVLKIRPSELVCRILPVDSVILNGVRCYSADEPLVRNLFQELFES